MFGTIVSRALLLWLALATPFTALYAHPPDGGDWREEDGFLYRLAIIDGVQRRVYADPVGRAVDWEVQNHLHRMGLTDHRRPRPHSGIDAAGHCWQRDDVGYAYYVVYGAGCPQRVYYQPLRRAVAGQVRNCLSHVDFQTAVRDAARSLVVRGFNGADTAPAKVRQSVRDAVVRSLNKARPDRGELSGFQQLVQDGIEDALVEALNQIEVLPALSPETSQERNETAARSTMPQFDENYQDMTNVSAGWIVNDGKILPLTGGDAFTVAELRKSPDLVDVWQDGRRIAASCRFARYFEDARAIAQRSGRDESTSP